MASIQEIEKRWLEQFNASPLVKDGAFQPDLAKALFYEGLESEHAPIQAGFLPFYIEASGLLESVAVEELMVYLTFIGIDIEATSVLDAIARQQYTLSQVLDRAHDLLKFLAGADETLNIEAPFKSCIKTFYFFLLLETQKAGGIAAAKEKYLKKKAIKQQLRSESAIDEIVIDEEAPTALPDFYNKYVNIPPNYEEDEVAMELYDQIDRRNDSYFLTGKAGTGKSTFIHYFVQNTNKETLVLAFTGIAAINIGGQTIHSFFRLPLKPLLPEDEEITKFDKHWKNRKIIENVDTIIIDEVSMLRADILEAIDYSLRINGGDEYLPFGGKQMIFVGDIFQLPPVVNTGDPVQEELFSRVYESQYFFDAPSYKQLKPKQFEFERVHRQSNIDFVELLNQVRDGSIDSRGLDKLNSRYDPNYDREWSHREFSIMLTTTNKLADKENRRQLYELVQTSHYFEAKVDGSYGKDRYPADAVLELRENAQVMFVRNDAAENGKRWVNGTIGIVEHIGDGMIEVRLQDGSTHVIGRETWESRAYTWDRKKKRINSEVLGTFEQYPIKLAWAVTIHKSQGLTFDNVVIDLGHGAFVNGQLYTALSRCRTLEGITLIQKVRMQDVLEDERLLAFWRGKS